MNNNKITKVVCEIFNQNSDKLVELLQKIGIEHIQIQSGRSIVLREKKHRLLGNTTIILEEDPIDIYHFYIPSKDTEFVVSKIAGDMNLIQPGNGSVYTESIEIVNESTLNFINENVIKTEIEEKVEVYSHLIGIRCIVQRGEGNNIVRSALDMGINVPSVTFGEGTGLRDKLGLLRITIPAEKEIVNIIINENDADEIMNILIDAGRLDLPGKGFIYYYPAGIGILNSMILRGKQKHAASMEQVILAIDHIKTNTDWRKRSLGSSKEGNTSQRKYLNGLVDFSFLCNEGRAMDLVKEAMSVGAAGATISNHRYNNLLETKDSISPAREMANMIISEKQVNDIIDVMKKAGLFDSSTYGIVEMKPAPKACTYLG